jgi:hypothetical protein
MPNVPSIICATKPTRIKVAISPIGGIIRQFV